MWVGEADKKILSAGELQGAKQFQVILSNNPAQRQRCSWGQHLCCQKKAYVFQNTAACGIQSIFKIRVGNE